MKSLVFIEHSRDLENLKFYLDKKRLYPEDLLIVNLDSELDSTFDASLTVKKEEDYLDCETYEGINEKADRLSQILCNEEECKPYFTQGGANLLEAEMKDFSRFFVWILKRIRFVKRVLEKENTARVHLFSFPEDFRIEKVLPNKFEKIINHIILKLKESHCLEVKFWQDVVPCFYPKQSKRMSWRRRLSCWLCNGARVALNRYRYLNAKDKETLLFFGNPTLLFPVIKEALKEGRSGIIYYQEEIAPRILFRLWSKNVAYLVSQDFLGGANEELQDKSRINPTTVPSEVLKNFVSEDVDYGELIIRRLNFLLKDRVTFLAKKVKAYKARLQKENVRCVVIDQDITEYNKLFILAANSLSIPTVEVLHGVPAYVVATPLSCDRKLVWGNFIRERFLEYGLIDDEKIVVTGNPRFDALREIDRKKCREEVRNHFKIVPERKIVLVTTQPYKSGNNVGLVNVHLTHREKENNMRQILRGLASNKGVHLILKLHPNETNLNFEKAIVQEEVYRGPVSFVQKYNIYKLLVAADLLITTWSNTVLEAVILNTPVIMINFTGREDVHPYAQWRGVRGVCQPELLEEAIEKSLALGERGIDQKAREKIIEEFAYKVDGQSAKRVYAEIQKLLQEKEQDVLSHSRF